MVATVSLFILLNNEILNEEKTLNFPLPPTQEEHTRFFPHYASGLVLFLI